MSKCSVIIIHYNRIKHLLNTLAGLQNSQKQPDEVILVNMGVMDFKLPSYTFTLKIQLLSYDNTNPIPLARARNEGAKTATNDLLVFLDVDCIPASDFLGTITQHYATCGQLLMGTPRYLLHPIAIATEEAELVKNSVLHPIRPVVEDLQKELSYGHFWSLCFCIDKKIFFSLGGFDELFTGYGGEDTDFAFKAKEANTAFFLSSATVYHQQHTIHIPPLQNVEAIVENCNYFYQKWAIWPMDKHLKAFKKQNLIDWSPEQKEPIKLLKKPEASAIAKSAVADAPFG